MDNDDFNADVARIAARLEHDAWKAVCKALREVHAVTDDDLNAPVSSNATPGQRLLNQIRAWGDARAELEE